MNQPTEARVLLVDDDRELCQMLGEYLSAEHFEVKSVHDGGDALVELQQNEFEILILDVMLPSVGGFDVLRKLGATYTTPILMLTARGDDVDRIVGLELGADDYLSKPFNPRELVARIRAILRRAEPPPIESRRFLVNSILSVDLDKRAVALVDGSELALTSAEFDLLGCFLARPNRVLSREQLMDWTRGRQADPLDRTIDVQVSRLRKKLERDGELLIKTVRSAGYIFTGSVKEA